MPISSVSRKPRVVRSPSVAPWRSMMALVTSVVPCTSWPRSEKRRPAARSSSSSPSSAPADGSLGVVRHLWIRIRPVSVSCSTKSVKVPPMSKPIRYRIGFDIGGTFTDFVLHDTLTGRIRIHKCLTTPKDPSAGALDGLEELLRAAGLRFSDLGQLVHGTTLVTNAIIERHGATLGLLTTRGFRDTLEMGIEQRYDIYDLFLRFPEPLAPRHLRREIDERVGRDGVVITPIDLDQVRREVAHL